MFTEKDLQQIQSKGINVKTINKQINNFIKDFPHIKLIAPATNQDGLKVFSEEEVKKLAAFYDKESIKKDTIKFVPASGAATRMFKHLFEFVAKYKNTEDDYQELLKDMSFNSVFNVISRIKDFAFYDELKSKMKNDGIDIDGCLNEKNFTPIIDYILSEKGLNYSKSPKGLIKFHYYDDGSRMSIEEHLIEGANYCKDENNHVKVHFTVSPEHLKDFKEEIDKTKGKYEKKFGIIYDISFSVQKSSTDTIAVDLENKPFRETDGSLLFRPGGHGALIENLNDLEADIIFVKNIDNIVPDRLRDTTYLYKKALAGYLLKLQEKTNNYLKLLKRNNLGDDKLYEIELFAKDSLEIVFNTYLSTLNNTEKSELLFKKLNRPIRICGMVKNEGEPGGGPFWTKNSKGVTSLQIVESSQMDLNDPEQKEIVSNATHFNPVDLICSVRDFKGRKFDLKKFVDQNTGFISIKSKDGKSLKAQELPGLWNGAMADWITIFVECPIITFNPVKTVNDLLREQHQA
ncbi:MAG: DUF4301 family protein [Bacteroidales bacterium]|nr:DUF4301 family protein [Bacteroidales bacterium]